MKSLTDTILEKLQLTRNTKEQDLKYINLTNNLQIYVFNKIVEVTQLNRSADTYFKSPGADKECIYQIRKWIVDNNVEQVNIYCTDDDAYQLETVAKMPKQILSAIKINDDMALKLGREKYKTVYNSREGLRPSLRLNNIAMEFATDTAAIYILNAEAL